MPLLRTYACHREPWCDKTMSVLQEKQLEACQERLMRCPQVSIFDVTDEEEARDWVLQELYQWSLEKKRSFDTRNFVVSNWNEVIEEVRRIYG